MSETLVKKVALITGGSSGIGLATAKALVKSGWSVAVAARRENRLNEFAETAKADGGNVLPLTLDLTDSASIRACVTALFDHFGRVDAVVHSAGAARPAPISHSDDELLRFTFETNVIGPTQLSREVIHHWAEAGTYGDFFFISSEQARMELPHLVHYGASKVALEFIARGIQRELAGTGCRCTVMQVGAVETEFRSHFATEDLISMMRSWEKAGIPRPKGDRLPSMEVGEAIAYVLNRSGNVHLDRFDMLPLQDPTRIRAR